MIKLSDHQSRVLAALWMLEQRHEWRWWSRGHIGHVVGAGGYHQVIQVATIRALKDAGLIQTQRSSWPADVQRLVDCGCACCGWGLTEKGRVEAERIAPKIRWTDEAQRRVYECRLGAPRWHTLDDEDDHPFYRRGDDDDDDGGGDDAPRHPVLGGACA